MTDAKTLLLEVLAVIPNGDKVAPPFAEDGVLEPPFLYAVGMPTRYRGRSCGKAANGNRSISSPQCMR